MTRLVPRHGISFAKVKGMTKQSDKERCNINSIMSKFATTGLIDYVNPREPVYDDVSNVPTFEEAQNARILSKEIYDNLPEHVKKEYSYEELATGQFEVETVAETPHSPDDTSRQTEGTQNEN